MSDRVVVMFVVLLGLISGPASAQVTDQQVRNAIRQGVNALYGMQNGRGTWDEAERPEGAGEPSRDWGGRTALAVYALLSCGEEWQKNPRMERALEFLKEIDIKGVYSRGIRAHVWAKLPRDQFGEYLERDGYWLLNAVKTQGEAAGGYDYTSAKEDNKPGGRTDMSVTQYGGLGIWECAKRDFAVHRGYWEAFEKHALAHQNADGGFGYQKGRDSTGSMTSSGLAIMFITLDFLHAGDFQNPGITDRHPLWQRINSGLDWFGQNFSPTNNPGGSRYYYYIVGVERVGLASGYKYFNQMDWYAEIAENLVSRQNGGWGNEVDTAFALIFLSRGRVPAVVNKLAIPDYDWNNRPRDMANLTSWLSDEVEQFLNWQVVTLDTEPAEWLDAPLLYLASHEPLALEPEQEAKIKRYIDLGGLLVTHADGGSGGFTRSVEQMLSRLYPEYELKAVPPDDDLYSVNYKVRGGMNLQSLDNGVRHLVVHIPRDIGASFQVKSMRNLAAWQTFANVFHYATEVGRIRPRLETHHVRREPGVANTLIPVARPRHAGNWNPEPAAWDVLNNMMFNNDATEATLVTDIDLANLDPDQASLAHIVGTRLVQFSDEQAAAVRRFAEGGGVVLLEAAGGSADFGQAIEQLLGKAFADRSLRPISLTVPVITGQGLRGGHNCSRVDYRAYYKQRLGPEVRPMLQAIEIDGQPRVLVSFEDLSTALLHQPVWGVFGYDSESATHLMSNIARWAYQVHPVQPAEQEPEPADFEPAG